MEIAPYPKFHLYRRIVQAKLFIDRFYAENIDVNNIADEAYFSKYHFIRLFKTTYGKTPHQYLKQVRIDRAQQLLKEEKTVSEACQLVGFESLTSFSGLFKKTVGVSPSTFLNNHKRKNSLVKKAPMNFVPGCYAHQNGWYENSNFEEPNQNMNAEF